MAKKLPKLGQFNTLCKATGQAGPNGRREQVGELAMNMHGSASSEKESHSTQPDDGIALPPHLGEDGLLVGYSLERVHPKIPFGFSFGDDAYSPSRGYVDPYLFCGDGHLLTIAPTGAGKGVACVIPALLRHRGDAVIMDPKGENYSVTAKFRRSLGQEVILIDPYGVVKRHGCPVQPNHRALDVFQVLPYLSDSEEGSAESLAAMLLEEDETTKDPFWTIAARNILSGVIDYYAHEHPYGDLDSLIEDLSSYSSNSSRPFKLRNEAEKYLNKHSALLDACKQGWVLPSDILRAVISDERDLDADLTEFRDPFWVDSYVPQVVDYDVFERRIQELAAQPLRLSETNKMYESGKRALSYAAELQDAADKVLRRVASHQSSDERFPYPIAVLRMMTSKRALCQRVSDMVLSTPSRTWGSMLTTLQNSISYLNAPGVRACLSESAYDWSRLEEGNGTSIYIVIPPHRLNSSSRLAAAIFKSIINVLSARSSPPKKRTLFLMDEVAQLGTMEEFIAAKTLLRGYGVQIWSFWQELSQLKTLYPLAWPTIINNCKVIQAFGCATPLMAAGLNELFDVPKKAIIDLEEREMLLSVYGDEVVVAMKPAYFSDPAFEGRFGDNPLIEGQRKSVCNAVSVAHSGVKSGAGSDIAEDSGVKVMRRRAKRFKPDAPKLDEGYRPYRPTSLNQYWGGQVKAFEGETDE